MSVLDEKFEDKSGEAAAPQSGAPSDQSTGVNGSAAAPAVSEPAAAPPAAEHRDPERFIPIEVLLRTRDEGNAAKARVRELEAREAERERKRQEAAAKAEDVAPDQFVDPEGYNAYWAERIERATMSVREQVAAERQQERYEDSLETWKEKLGDEKFDELEKWLAEEAPEAVHAHCLKQRSPYGAAYKVFQETKRRERAAALQEKLGDDDLETFLEKQRAQWIADNGQPAAQVAPQAAPAERPRAPDGKFAPTPQPAPRRSAPSLASVSAAPAAATPSHSNGSALDQRYS